jgi:hypothetical protein
MRLKRIAMAAVALAGVAWTATPGLSTATTVNLPASPNQDQRRIKGL